MNPRPRKNTKPQPPALLPPALPCHLERIPAALKTVYDADKLVRDHEGKDLPLVPDDARPAAHPSQVFDMPEHGVRIIISREVSRGRTTLHASGSVLDAAAFTAAMHALKIPVSLSTCVVFMDAVVRSLFPDRVLVLKAGVLSPGKKVPHFWYDDVGG